MADRLKHMVPLAAAFLLFYIGISQAVAGPEPKTVQTVMRSYYLSLDGSTGDMDPLSCADGYHFANAWELQDVSNMAYNAELGHTRDDSGYGPPDGYKGWIRTGRDESDFYNCLGWTWGVAGVPTDYKGIAMSLDLEMSYEGGELKHSFSPVACNHGLGVWCVSDPIY